MKYVLDASALTKAERQKIINQGESLDLLDNIFSTAPQLFPYDSTYLAISDLPGARQCR